jgi:Na+-translocating ferredoxin:NAD+ oxidoreductase RnfD subunit
LGRIIAGILAGICNAAIRSFTKNSEGIVYTFLLINVLSPTIDRFCFLAHGIYLRLRQKWWRRKVLKTAQIGKIVTD